MEYQNLFTQVQVVAPPHHGVSIDPYDERERFGEPKLYHLFGRLGNAQLGPIYLGRLGIASLFFGIIAIQIMGFNMLASRKPLLKLKIIRGDDYLKCQWNNRSNL